MKDIIKIMIIARIRIIVIILILIILIITIIIIIIIILNVSSNVVLLVEYVIHNLHKSHPNKAALTLVYLSQMVTMPLKLMYKNRQDTVARVEECILLYTSCKAST